MNDASVLSANHLSKCFKIYANPWHRALEWGRFGKRTYHQPFWALQDISFEVKRGEFFGIIGQNGAGKSTLLKILSGVLSPTSGTYQVNGRVLSMLELGMDFNPYLTGRDNVFRSTELLGFPDGYVQSKMEQIREFSELGDFFDRPVRLYSTGMSARLAFSIYAFLDCDVLILDEVLAVGDLFFRQKCYARLEELIAKQTTIIFVTHAMDAVRQYCQQVILLDKGCLLYHGKPEEAIRRYHRLKHGWGLSSFTSIEREDFPQQEAATTEAMDWPAEAVFTPVNPGDNHRARLIKIALCNQQGEASTYFTQGERAYIYAEFELLETIGVPVAGVMLTNQFNVLVHGKASFQYGVPVPHQVRQGQVLRLRQVVTLGLAPGEYVLGCGLMTFDATDGDAKLERLCIHQQAGFLIVTPDPKQGILGAHLGLCDLDGACQIYVIDGS